LWLKASPQQIVSYLEKKEKLSKKGLVEWLKM
jgi:hypothetical protein